MEPCHRPVTLITGAAKRIGAQIARTLHGAGFDLGLHFRHSEAEMASLVNELEAARAGSTLAVQGDLADLPVLDAITAAVFARYGRIDVLVNNASTYFATPLDAATGAQWDALFASNARAPYFLSKACAPHLQVSRGCIINITDIYADRPLPGHAIYSMAKAALAMATKALAVELGPEVRVNAVAPGNILWSTNPVKAETLQTVIERTTLARQGSPDDIARAVLDLIHSPYISGHTLVVDGGRSLSI